VRSTEFDPKETFRSQTDAAKAICQNLTPQEGATWLAASGIDKDRARRVLGEQGMDDFIKVLEKGGVL